MNVVFFIVVRCVVAIGVICIGVVFLVVFNF